MTEEIKTSVIDNTLEYPKTYIYIGPTITNVIKKNNVYIGQLPPIETKLFEKKPFLKCLLIEVDKLSQFINSQQYSILYEQAAKELRR